MQKTATPNNLQPISKPDLRESGSLIVHSVFPTIQGEGPFAGVPAVFVRLFGCNLQCPLCDTDYTSLGITNSPEELLRVVESKEGAKPHWSSYKGLIVLTGGEPFRQNIAPFCNYATAKGYAVQIETNGTLYNPDIFYNRQVTVVCSPKTGKLNKQLIPCITAFKYVLHADSMAEDDGLPETALDHSCHPRLARPPKDWEGVIYLQPVDMGEELENKRHIDATVSSCLTHGYRLCLQTHKYVDLP